MTYRNVFRSFHRACEEYKPSHCDRADSVVWEKRAWFSCTLRSYLQSCRRARPDHIYNRAEKQSVHYYRESKTKLPSLAALCSGHDIRYIYTLFLLGLWNVAALVFYVSRLLRSWRLFVLRAFPGIH